uniref:G_PROTEIN_RECEP_F1_2 domain-containing protein n=1 Tax=Angiostrongylus cantonensis TaxID=6313 RepID=A0A0K0DMP8_ANGCA
MYFLKMKRYKLMWIVGILLWSMSYMFITFYCFAATSEYENYVRTPVMERLNRNIDKMSFFCVFPFVSVNVTHAFLPSKSRVLKTA